VLDAVDLDVPEAQVTALLGPNGAGKTTLVLALAGLLPIAAGDVSLDGVPLRGQRPEDIRSLGLAAVPEGHRVLTKLTVDENVRVAAAAPGEIERAWSAFPELGPLRSRVAGLLSGGEQQMLALAQALVARPRIVLVDEMSLGLAPLVVHRLMRVVTDLAADGVGVLLVEQFTNVALTIAQRAYVFNRGKTTFTGTAAQLLAHPDALHTAYLGPTPP
jgi:branched-chain amino acid transport system ATP-binding protein